VKEWLTNHYRKYFSAIEWLANHYRKYLNSLRITIWKLLQGKARISYAVLKEDGKYAKSAAKNFYELLYDRLATSKNHFNRRVLLSTAAKRKNNT
jgi:hypothetical protein